MPATIKPRKDHPRRFKTVRRKMKGTARKAWVQEPQLTVTSEVENEEPMANANSYPDQVSEMPLNSATPEAEDENQEALAVVVKKFREGIIIEQSVEYVAGKGKPVICAKIRLTTALRGKRKTDGLIEGAYILRLEVLAGSRAVKVEGLRLGPWQIDDMQLETGSVYLAEPIWAGFQPVSGSCNGRIHIGDVDLKRLLDLPLNTVAVLPGPEPFSG